VWCGKSIIFLSTKKGHQDIYRKAADLTGAEELLWEGGGGREPNAPTSCSSDGQFLLVNSFSPSGKAGGHIWKLPLTPERVGQPAVPTVFLDSGSFTEVDGKFSPDGHWVAYSSNESQRYEIYVTAFPGPGGKQRISVDGGTSPRWSDDGKEIFYVDPKSTLQSAEIINKRGTIEVGQTRPVFRGLVFQRGYLYDVSRDGSRFLTKLLTGPVVQPRLHDR